MDLTREDRIRLGALLASRSVVKAKDAKNARLKRRHPSLIEQLTEDAEWSRGMAARFLEGNEEFLNDTDPASLP